MEDHWQQMSLSNECFIYFDCDTIKKVIVVNHERYYESQVDEKTANDRTILLPKTNRGKVQKLSVANLEKRTEWGNYFSYNNGRVLIANMTAQSTYYDSKMASENCNGIENLHGWLDNWIANTTEQFQQEMEQFRNAKRKHCKFDVGDFFRFKIDRGLYGYGRILFNFDRLRADKVKFWDIFAGKPYVVKVYHIITESKVTDLQQLRKLKAIPSQNIMDNNFYYGDYEIIGNLPLEEKESDFPIMYGKGLDFHHSDAIKFQCGPVYKCLECSHKKLVGANYRNNASGFTLNVDKNILEKCIKRKSNAPYWNRDYYLVNDDLRNPKNARKLRKVLRQFKRVKAV